MRNVTPDDFKGNLVTFADTRKGKEVNKTCEKYSDWGEPQGHPRKQKSRPRAAFFHARRGLPVQCAGSCAGWGRP